MAALIIDVHDLLRYMEYAGIRKDTLEGSISRYLSKAYSIPCHYKTGYPAHPKLLSTEELDNFFSHIDLEYLINELKGSATDAIVDIRMDRFFLCLSIKDTPPCR